MTTKHERVQARIPRLVDGSLPEWRRRLVLRHIARCGDCGAELERQFTVQESLHEIRSESSAGTPEPPDELLESILRDVNQPGLRARAAVPVRGAVSGARPELSVAGLLLTAAVVYLIYRVVRGVVDVLDDER